MRLTEIRLERFRNLADMGLEVPPEGAVLVGPNGHGKTNFLEAVHYLSRFRSFRGTTHSDAVAFGAGHFRIEAGFVADGHARSLAVSADGERRRIALDGAAVGRPSDAAGTLLAVSVRPEDLELVTGSPSARRGFVDELLALASRPYRRALAEYDRVLRQRTELLRMNGAEIVYSPGDQGSNGALAKALEMAEADAGYYMPYQYGNVANREA